MSFGLHTVDMVTAKWFLLPLIVAQGHTLSRSKESVSGIIEEITMESKADSVEPSSKRDFMDIFEWRPYRPVANAWMAI